MHATRFASRQGTVLVLQGASHGNRWFITYTYDFPHRWGCIRETNGTFYALRVHNHQRSCAKYSSKFNLRILTHIRLWKKVSLKIVKMATCKISPSLETGPFSYSTFFLYNILHKIIVCHFIHKSNLISFFEIYIFLQKAICIFILFFWETSLKLFFHAS